MQGSGAELEDGTECTRCGRSGSDVLGRHVQLLYTECGHCICDKCKKRMFQGKSAALCPRCNSVMRLHLLTTKSPAEKSFEHELHIRRRLSEIFNKRREDFDSLEAYNEYLEMVEEKADALRSGGDKEAVEAALAQYKSLHAREINLATEAARRRREMEQVQAKHDIALRLQRAAAANPKDAYAQEAAEAAAAAARAASHSAAAPGSHAGQGVAGPTLEAVHLRPLPRRAAPELGPVVADPAVRAERFWVQHRGGKIPPGISRRKLEASVQGATKLAGGLDAAAVKERLLRDTMAGL